MVTCVCARVHPVKCPPCCHGMAHPLVADGQDDLQIWKVAVNNLNNQSGTARNV